MLTAILCNILVQVIVAGPAALVVGVCYLGGMQLEFAVLCGLPLLIIPGWIFAMMLLQAQLFIVDRNAGVIEAMSLSTRVMVGNKLLAFALLLVTGILSLLFTLLTCGVGVLAAGPYVMILTVMIYLGVTGQPTMLDQHVAQPQQGGGTPFGQGTPGNSPFGA